MKSQSLHDYFKNHFVGKRIVLYSFPRGSANIFQLKKPHGYGRYKNKTVKITPKIKNAFLVGQRMENTKNRCNVYLSLSFEGGFNQINIQMSDKIQLIDKKTHPIIHFFLAFFSLRNKKI